MCLAEGEGFLWRSQRRVKRLHRLLTVTPPDFALTNHRYWPGPSVNVWTVFRLTLTVLKSRHLPRRLIWRWRLKRLGTRNFVSILGCHFGVLTVGEFHRNLTVLPVTVEFARGKVVTGRMMPGKAAR